METDFRTVGLNCAVIRTLICLVLMFFPFAGTEFSWHNGEISLTSDVSALFFSGIVAALLLGTIALNWIWALKGGAFRFIKRFCNESENPEAMMMRMEKVWNEGFATRDCRLDTEYFIWVKKMRSVVIPLRDIYNIAFDIGVGVSAGNLYIGLKDGTFKTFTIREKDGTLIEDYIKQNIPEIIVGDWTAHIFKDAVGSIDKRYHVRKINEQYFIVEASTSGKLNDWPFFREVFRFRKSEVECFWRAWELSEAELQDIEYSPYKRNLMSPGTSGAIGFGLGMSLLIFMSLSNFNPFTAWPIHAMVGGHSGILLAIAICVVLGVIFDVKKPSKFDPTKYREVRLSQKSEAFTKSHLIKHLALQGLLILTAVFGLMGILFFWNVGVLVYVIYLFFLYFVALSGVSPRMPKIDPQCVIQYVQENQKGNS